MKRLLLLTFSAIIGASAGAQTSSKTAEEKSDTSEQYLPVEGKSKTGVPAQLQGSWVLVTGLKNTIANTAKQDFDNKKMAEGAETRHDSTTTSTTVNGITQTTTEVEIDKTVVPEKAITPQQGNKMHNPSRPSISFYGANETFSGFTGCNKFSGRYSVQGSKISLTNAAASTKMACLGEYDEKQFLETLKKVSSFRTNNDQLQLLNGEDVLLVFDKK